MPNQHLRTIFVVYASCTLRLLATWCTQTFEPRRNPSLCLYWRSHAHLPTGRRSRPFHRGTSPLQALTNKTGRWRSMVAPGESARSRKIAAVRDLRGHAALPSYVPRERHTGGPGWPQATAAAARSVLDGPEHAAGLARVGTSICHDGPTQPRCLRMLSPESSMR